MATVGNATHFISPTTGMLVSKQIFPARIIKKYIREKVDDNTIRGELAAKYKEKRFTEQVLQKAELGHVHSMERLAKWYAYGEHGFQKDNMLACIWAEKAARLGSVLGMALAGQLLLWGPGVPHDKLKAMMYLGMAEGRGSDYAAFVLGRVQLTGAGGVQVDKRMAHQFLTKCLSAECVHKHIGNSGRRKARYMIGELQKANRGFNGNRRVTP